MFNRIILIGNLTRDVEVRYTPSGTAVADIGIAVNTKSKGAGGDTKEETLFINFIVFSKTAENCAEYLHKGSKVLVEGRLRERRWEKDGQKHSKMEVIANTVRFLTAKGSVAGSGGSSTDGGHAPDEVTDVEPF